MKIYGWIGKQRFNIIEAYPKEKRGLVLLNGTPQWLIFDRILVLMK